jgi:glycosyltransferase involved in cell wall biosynthesis
MRKRGNRKGFSPISNRRLRAHSLDMITRVTLSPNPLPALGKWMKPVLAEVKRLSARRDPSTPASMISVIIPAHNEEGYLERTLSALRRQNYQWYEVIVVANGCTDRTAEIARAYCDRLIVLSQKSLGVARNLGARMAKGELLMFLDADTTLEPMALRRIAEDFHRGDAAGTVKGRPNCYRRKYRVIYWLKNFLHRWSLHTGSSGVIICWKEQFIHCGGFDEGLEVRENSDLIKRLRRFGKYRFIGDVAATTSMRRYERHGFGRVLWLWSKLWFQSLFFDLHRRHYETVR